MRGPELSYTKPDDVYRILYLGDSVTFGFLIEFDADTFPYEAETRLEAILEQEIETINAGVGGYSPWQAYQYLVDEGWRYEPDLIILSFVLNDVTEKFELPQFGGANPGYQMAHTIFSAFDRWASYSSVLYHLKQTGLSLRSRAEIQTMAQIQEKVDVEMLVHQPNHPAIKTAWQVTLENVDRIFQATKQQKIPFVLVIFPFTFQFEDINALSAPQMTLSQFAQKRDIPTLDLLPLLAEKMASDNLPPEAYFFDEDHLSHYGSEVVAEMIVAFLVTEGIVYN